MGLLGGWGVLGAWRWRAGEGESGRPGAWQTTLQTLISSMLPTSIKEMRIPRAKAPCIPSNKRKEKSLKGVGRATSRTPSLTLSMS
eukprot:1153205-Pelagomonas_calceolata.AAC.4